MTQPEPSSFKKFQELLTGYRESEMIRVAHRSGVFEVIGKKGADLYKICMDTGWAMDAGSRFLDALSEIGFLKSEGDQYRLTRFAERYFLKNSPEYQGAAIEFEERLVRAWAGFEETLKTGKRVFETEEKANEKYLIDLEAYLDAMDAAAKIRAEEVWATIRPQKKGIIVDCGAGSGAFLKSFLNRHKGWEGLFCDLEDVVRIAHRRTGLKQFGKRIRFHTANFFETVSGVQEKADMILLSNLIHCQGVDETEILIKNALEFAHDSSVVIIHDFFKDSGQSGNRYDLHMMVNTWNGRTYSLRETEQILMRYGFCDFASRSLYSDSQIFLASKKKILKDLLL